MLAVSLLGRESILLEKDTLFLLGPQHTGLGVLRELCGCDSCYIEMEEIRGVQERGQPHQLVPPVTLLEPPRSQVSSVSFAAVETTPKDQAEEIGVRPTAQRDWGNYRVADDLITLKDTPLLLPWMPPSQDQWYGKSGYLRARAKVTGGLCDIISRPLGLSWPLKCSCFPAGLFFLILGGRLTPVQPSNPVGFAQFPPSFPLFSPSLPPSFSSSFSSFLLFNKYYLSAYHTPVIKL